MPPGKTLKDLEKQWFPEDKDLEIVASPHGNVKNRFLVEGSTGNNHLI